MDLYAILVFEKSDSIYKLKQPYYNLDQFSFFYRYVIRDTIESIALEAVNKFNMQHYYKISEKVNEKEIIIYGSSKDTKCFVIITNSTYPSTTATQLMYELINSIKPIAELFAAYQKPADVDKLVLIRQELESSKTIILESLDALIDRGEELPKLLDRTEALLDHSLEFSIKAKEMNRCCIIF